jgi:hypothetical protein
MIHRLVLLCAALLFGPLVFCQKAWAVDGPAPLAAADLLSGQFTMERHLAGFGQPLTSTGSFHLSPAKGLIWAVEAPFPSVTVVTGAGISQGIGIGQLSHLDGSERAVPFVTLIGAVLSGDWNALEDSFSVTTETGEKAGGNTNWQAILTPRPNGTLSNQIEAIKARGGRVVEAVTLRRTGGDWDAITLTDQSIMPPPLPPAVTELFTEAAQEK